MVSRRKGSRLTAAGAEPTNTLMDAHTHVSKPVFGNARFQQGNKFKVSPKEERTLDGVVFDSKLEKKFYEILSARLPGVPLHMQTTFLLQPPFRTTHDGKVVRGIHYRADFVLGGVGGTHDDPHPLPGSMVIDAKGMLTPVFALASKLFQRKFGNPIRPLKTQKQLLAAIEQWKKYSMINQTIKDRAEDRQPFTIQGYERGDGSVVNLTVRFLGPDGYLQLARESLVELERTKGLYASAVESEAAASVSASLAKAVGERDTAEDTPARASKETLEPVCDNVSLLNGHPTHVAAFRLEILAEEVIKAPDKVVKSKDAASACKKRITATLPVSRYCHRLNLYEGKYEKIS